MDIFEFEFMQRAFFAGALVGIVCSVVGVFVVLRGLAFIGAGISHSALAGVAIGILAGVPPLFSSLVFCSFIAVFMGFISRLGRIREDTAIGIFFAGSMAFGVLLISFASAGSFDLLPYLFGSILTVSFLELCYSALFSLITIVIVCLCYKELVSVVFDEELAILSGIPARFMSYLLLVLISVAIVASMKLVGIVLVSALIVTPAATALQLARDIDVVMKLAILIGLVETELGLALAYYMDVPPGAMIVVLSTFGFVVAALWRKRA